ncbi:MAG TPA: M12 family metallopeptidase [Polyangiales bacterium]|nr:M12 family metallopeptidase [Polyangiales bacterium]
MDFRKDRIVTYIASNTSEPLVCTPKSLPEDERIGAAEHALAINPANQPHPLLLAAATLDRPMPRARLALFVSKRWQSCGVRLTVGFLDNPPAELRARILAHMNAWNKTANVAFVETKTDPQVRIACAHDGHWSYLGTDILRRPKHEQTMNLDGFTMNTPESEFFRVVRHETGHTLGFPHEHMRKEFVSRIDLNKAFAYFERTQGWDQEEVRHQVLTALESRSLLGTMNADASSIMCYQLPGEITTDGRPILGGTDIDLTDYEFAASVYPLACIEAATR